MSQIPFRWHWKAFWWGFFHPFIGEEEQHRQAVKFAKQWIAERDTKEQP